MKKPAYDDAAIARIADAASCDPRSVVRYLAGLPLRPKTQARIVEAVKKIEA
jgi:hypothetical protein